MRPVERLLRGLGVIEREREAVAVEPSEPSQRLEAAQRMAEVAIVRANRATAHTYRQMPSWEDVYLGPRR